MRTRLYGGAQPSKQAHSFLERSRDGVFEGRRVSKKSRSRRPIRSPATPAAMSLEYKPRRAPGIRARHRVEHQCAILRGPSHRSDMVECRGHRPNSAPFDKARMSASARRRRTKPPAPGSIRQCQCRSRRRRGQPPPRPRRRSTTPPGSRSRSQGFRGRRPRQVERHSPDGEFPSRKLAEHDRAFIAHAPHGDRILAGRRPPPRARNWPWSACLRRRSRP